jgi:hypothetical protein
MRFVGIYTATHIKVVSVTDVAGVTLINGIIYGSTLLNYNVILAVVTYRDPAGVVAYGNDKSENTRVIDIKSDAFDAIPINIVKRVM